jgi:hypothetical protein
MIAIPDPIARRDALIHALRDLGCSFEIRAQEMGDGWGANIVVPFGRGNPRLVIGAHYDSAPGSSGANDNGSGVAILIDLIRTLESCKIQKPVEIVFFDLEEQNLAGSRAYTEGSAANEISAMINLDICGLGDCMVVAPRENLNREPLKRIVRKGFQSASHRIHRLERLPAGDEQSFIRADIPAITVGIVPQEDIPLIAKLAAGENLPDGRLPSVGETIHNGPRDSIEVIEETALQVVRNWLGDLVKRYCQAPQKAASGLMDLWLFSPGKPV